MDYTPIYDIIMCCGLHTTYHDFNSMSFTVTIDNSAL